MLHIRALDKRWEKHLAKLGGISVELSIEARIAAAINKQPTERKIKNAVKGRKVQKNHSIQYPKGNRGR